jgi:hypothetical protein
MNMEGIPDVDTNNRQSKRIDSFLKTGYDEWLSGIANTTVLILSRKSGPLCPNLNFYDCFVEFRKNSGKLQGT